MRKMLFFALAFALGLPLAAQEKGKIELPALEHELTAPNHVYGRALDPEDLGQRVVVLWNISRFVEPGYNRLKAAESGDDDDDNNNNYRNNRNNDEDKEGGPKDQLREESRAIQRASKGAVKDGRLLVIAVDVQPADPELRRFRTDAIRELKPYFPVYSIDANSQYYDASGKHRGMISDIKTFAEGNRLTDLLAETPDYIPGRIITFKTTKMESLSKRFVEGKNIEQPLKQLRTAANGSGVKAEEAQRMLAAVEAHLAAMAADIDADLKAAPSRALTRIEVLMKTSPSMGARYAGARQALRNNPAVRQLARAREFLHKANHGDVGRGDTGRQADAFAKALTAMSKSDNASIAAEAAELAAAMEPYSAATLAAQQEKLHEEIAARRKARDEARKEREQERRDRRSGRSGKGKEEDDPDPVQRFDTAGAILAKTSGDAAIAPLRAELDRLNDATCNYERIRENYATHVNQQGERGAAAKAVTDAINANRQTYLTELEAIQKESRPLDLYSTRNWEQILEVNYPSLQRTPAGSEAVKMLRDSELRAIYGVYEDVLKGTPDREEDESNEDYAVSTNRYRQTKLKALLKYRGSRSKYGRMAAAQLDTLGYSNAGIQQKLKDFDAQLKDLKKSAKEAEKAREEAQKNARRNRD